MSSCTNSNEPLIVADGGLDSRADTSRPQDPYAALFELMVVVEALCPTWPPRESTFKDSVFIL